jgi:RND superfamily putative drug exporter
MSGIWRQARGAGGRLAGWAGLAGRYPKLVVGLWVLAAVAVTVFVPPLESVVRANTTPFLPADSPMQRGLAVMDTAFGSGQAQAFAFVVLADGRGLSGADQRYYGRLARRLAAGRSRVAEVQDYASQPQLRQALSSRDGQAAYIPVGLRHELGSPQSIADIGWLRARVRGLSPPPGLRVYVTGEAAMIADLNGALMSSEVATTLLAAGAIVVILLLIYRRPATLVVPLATIAVGVLCTRGLVALLGMHGLPVSTYTGAFLVAVALGAGTDYSVFVISRYQENLAAGMAPADAARASARRLRGVLAASAGTIVIASAAMLLARLALFRTTGPAIGLAAGTTALVGLTLTPALLTLAGRRAAAPRGDQIRRWWAKTGALVARRPGRTLAAGVLLLVALAAAFPAMRLSFDESALQPAATGSNRGYQALDAHFPRNEVLPGYLLITAGHDLRNPRDLAVLAAVTRLVGKVPGVAAVRSVTQPLGRPLPQASLAAQITQIGDQLARSARGQPGTGGLAADLSSLSGGARQLAVGSGKAAGAVGLFLPALRGEQQGLATAAGRTGQAAGGAAQLSGGARLLATVLTAAQAQTGQAAAGLGQIYQALTSDPLCTLDPVCARSRAALGQIYHAERGQLVPGLGKAATAARAIAGGNANLAGGLRQLHAGLAQAAHGLTTLTAGEHAFGARLGQLAAGAAHLSGGLGLLAPGIRQLAAATGKLSTRLGQAGHYLHTAGASSASAGTGGFYLPARGLTGPQFALARTAYLSHDGHIARLVIISASPPLQPAGAAQLRQAQNAAQLALRATPLRHATITATGAAALGTDLGGYLRADTTLIVPIVLTAVLLILITVLRALIAPAYLLASVVLSYAATMGITTLTWQYLLHRPIEWTVPIIGFVVLVAVGTDYNILLATRIREEGPATTRPGIARAVAATGGVITSAGLIFASSFTALATSPVTGLAENGFAIATGLILDTFIVRTLLVPSAAALLGRWNWWPSAPQPRHDPARKLLLLPGGDQNST